MSHRLGRATTVGRVSAGGCHFCRRHTVAPTFGPRQHPGQVQFRICGDVHHMSLSEFGVLLRLYTDEEIDTDLYRLARHEDSDDVIASWWLHISDSPWVGKARSEAFLGFLSSSLRMVVIYVVWTWLYIYFYGYLII
ncbi:hypothetical protein R6Q57_000654 [Mikania cordata]